MAEGITFLQHWIFSKFLFPFLLVFFIIFAVLEKTKIFGTDKKQLNALISFVIGLIFIGAIYPKLVVENLILFLTVTIVAVFVVLLIWGFIFGDVPGSKLEKGLKLGLGLIATIAFIGAVLWATGWNKILMGFISGEEGGLGQTIITNGVFLIVIAIALALVFMGSKKEGK